MTANGPTATPRSRPIVARLTGAQRLDWAFVLLPCAILLTLLGIVYATDADVAVSRFFYNEERGRWPLADIQPWLALYEYGCRPSIWIGVAGLATALASLVLPSLGRFREAGLFLALTLAIGPGILVNGVLKPGVGRPRPCQTVPFGGEMDFAYLGSGVAGISTKSFPSGHASMGFFMMTPALLFYRRRPRLAAAIFTLGLTYGVLISFARVAQGAHFTTDVIASALIVYASAVAVLLLLRSLRVAEWASESRTDANPLERMILSIRPKSAPRAADDQRRRAA